MMGVALEFLSFEKRVTRFLCHLPMQIGKESQMSKAIQKRVLNYLFFTKIFHLERDVCYICCPGLDDTESVVL
jgi:hypothetical protein